jgi:hypothetical protein
MIPENRLRAFLGIINKLRNIPIIKDSILFILYTREPNALSNMGTARRWRSNRSASSEAKNIGREEYSGCLQNILAF